MTYNKTKSLSLVLAFGAVLLAWPMAAQMANADGGSGSNPVCTVTPTASIAMGNIVPGADTDQIAELTWATPGNVDGTVEITAQDWIGVGTTASGVITLTGVATGHTVTINGVAKVADTDFVVGATDVITATNLAADITTDVESTTVPGVNPVAISVGNVVIVRSNVVGTVGNGVPLATGQGSIVVPTSGFLSDGEAIGATHAQSEMTKFNMGVGAANTQIPADYASKTALGEAGVLTVVLPRSDVTQDVKATFQVSGTGSLLEALPYSGALSQALVFSFTCFPAA